MLIEAKRKITGVVRDRVCNDRERESEDAVLRRLKQFRTTEEIDCFQLEHGGEE